MEHDVKAHNSDTFGTDMKQPLVQPDSKSTQMTNTAGDNTLPENVPEKMPGPCAVKVSMHAPDAGGFTGLAADGDARTRSRDEVCNIMLVCFS